MLATLDLEPWGLCQTDLQSLSQLASVRVHLAYPGYQAVIQLAPRERLRQIDAQYRQAYQRLVALLPGTSFIRLGSRNRPTGLAASLPLAQLSLLVQQPFVSEVTIETIEGLTCQERAPEPSFWCIQARFAIQIENETKGMQKYEDRLLVIRALTEEEAKQKLLPSFEAYAEPYLNSAGLLVRWQFEDFTDSYCLDIQTVDTFLSEQGVEVFSTLNNRRLRAGMEWQPNS
jgi:hypothetical protein